MVLAYDCDYVGLSIDGRYYPYVGASCDNGVYGGTLGCFRLTAKVAEGSIYYSVGACLSFID